jgi:hypothetical protein
MQIIAILDQGDSDLDPIDPLGSIFLKDDAGRQLSQSSIWLDEWLGGILAGLQSIETSTKEARINLGSEPHPLIFKSDPYGITIEFQNESICIGDLLTFKREFKKTLLKVTDVYRSHSNWSKCEEFHNLRDWAESGL